MLCVKDGQILSYIICTVSAENHDIRKAGSVTITSGFVLTAPNLFRRILRFLVQGTVPVLFSEFDNLVIS